MTGQAVPSAVDESLKGAAALRSERVTETAVGPDSQLQDLNPVGSRDPG